MPSTWLDLFQLPATQRPAHRIHLIGIGGTGLAPIAKVLVEMGFQISGSDQDPSPRTETLKKLGAIVHIGHDASNLQAAASNHPDLVLISSAIPDANPEISEARRLGIPVVKRSDMLGPLTTGRTVIAVAGTHGKTTTTGMIAHVLQQTGHAPGYIIGSSIPGLGISAAGKGPLFVIEADEYDYAFLGLEPDIAVLTSMDWDHPDCFPTRASYVDAFQRFLANLKPGGHVVYCHDDPNLQALAASATAPERWHGYGNRPGAAWRASDIDIRSGETAYTLHPPAAGAEHVRLAVPGLHNVLNSVGALVATSLVGVVFAQATPTLAGFEGAGRRFEIKGEAGGVLVIDDYAHHPTEVRTTLAAARAAYSDRSIWAIYQPHTYSRTRTFLNQFEGVFAAADHVIVTDIYASREQDDGRTTPEQVIAASRHRDARHLGDFPNVLAHLRAQLRPGSLVIILSAGTATQLGPDLLKQLEQKPSPALVMG